jgi:geranylgeranyl pyrophosphate synthase
LNVLEKAIDKILLAGIPCMAVPLLSSDCRNTSVDESWVMDMIQNVATAPANGTQTRSYVHLLRAANDMFQTDEFDRLVIRQRGSKPIPTDAADGSGALGGNDPIAATEALAFDFVRRGGKYSRPFITLAAYDAMSGGHGTTNAGPDHVSRFPDAVRRAAVSIEMFHKASLVHDDIEDDDGYRYGQPTMHRRFGLPTAINVGDYMIGLGYRLVSRETAQLGADCAADIMDCLANAHIRLAEGQGAELLWRDASDRRLTPLDALKIYALKTAPAFEAALYTGVRAAGDATAYVEPIRQFARNLGVAFQILNDLNDWQGDHHNKLEAGGDALGGRPTVLFALALASLNADDQAELLRLSSPTCDVAPAERVRRIERLYRQAKAFDQANRLIDKHQQRALEIVRDVAPEALQRLMIYLVDTVLERGSEPAATVVPLTQIQPLPVPNAAP